MLAGGLVGRDAEVRQLLELVRQSALGHGRSALVEGEPGIGKSRLMDVVADECERLDMRVLRCAAEEMERQVPFAAISACLAGAAAGTGIGPHGGAAVSVSNGVRDGGHEFTAVEAILDLVEQWCTLGPVAVLVDDLQWVDPSSLLVLHRLGRTISQLPLLMVGACRPMPREEPLERLLRSLRSRASTAITLGPLDDAAVAELVGRIAAARPGRGLLEQVAGAAGNPLYVTELVDALLRDGQVRVAAGAAELDGQRAYVSHSAAGAIVRRLDFLSHEARDILQICAVLGPSLKLTELSVILARPASALMNVIHEAVAAGLLTDSGDHLVFRHDLIREALAETVPAAMRTALHVQAGRALAASWAPVERVAYHLLASDTVDAATLAWLERSADSLTTRAPAFAVDLLSRAVSQMDAGDARARPLRYHLARALLWAGRYPEAERAARAALAVDPEPERQATLRWLLARACFQQAHLRDAETVAVEALAQPHLTAAQAARFQHFASQCRFTRGEVDLPVEEAAAKRLLALGDPDSTAYGLYHLCGVRFMQGRMAESLELAERAVVAFGTQDAQPEWDLAIHLMRAYLLVELDRSAEAEKAFETGLREAERIGSIYLTWYPLGKARLLFLDGRWDDALAEIRAGQETLEALGTVRGLHTGPGLRCHATLVALHRGTGVPRAADLEAPFEATGTFFDYLVLWSQALAWEAAGQPDRALAALARFWGCSAGARQQLGMHYLAPDLARLAVSQGDQAQAARVAEGMAELVAALPTPTLRGLYLLCQGTADADPDMLLDAADLLRDAGRPLYQAYARESAAAVLGHMGRTAEARRALAAALELYDGLDAAWDAARAKARLRGAGIRSRRHGTTLRAKAGWGALTDTERKVAALVAQGQSNPEIAAHMFISRRTVQSHVSSILTKLSCASRVELALVAARHAGG